MVTGQQVPRVPILQIVQNGTGQILGVHRCYSHRFSEVVTYGAPVVTPKVDKAHLS